MAGRFSVEGVFRVVDRMTRPIQRISSRLSRFQRAAGTGLRDLGRMGRQFQTGFLAVAAAITAAGVAALHVLRDVIETGMEFEQSITSAAAKFPGQIRRGSEAFAQLEEAAMRVGRETEFTASQAASAIDFLAMAGFNAEQAIAALPGVVDLATAAQMELGEATDIASDSLGAFGMMTNDATQLGRNLSRVNDVLARTSTSANTTVAQMFEAIQSGGPVAHAAGASIETFSGLLGQLAGAGIKGSEAGTALRNVFLRLQAPAAEGRRALRRLRVETMDGAGNMRDVNEIFGDLGRALDGMGTAQRARVLQDIFGTRAVTSANVLLEAGADRLNEYRATLEGATGAASEMADTMRDTTQGDINGMNSAIEGLKLSIFALVSGPLRGLVQGITEWVRANQGNIADGLQRAIAWLTENMPTIVTWARRIGIAFAIFATLAAALVALAVGPFILLSGILWGIVAVIVEAASQMWDWASSVAQSVGAAVSGVWQRIRAFFQGYIEFTVGLFVIIGRIAMRFLRPVFDLIGRAAAWVRQLWSPVGGFFSGLWDGIADAFSGAWDWIVDEAGWIYDWLVEIWEPIGDFFSGLWDGIADSFSSALGWVVDSISGLVGDVRAVGRGAMDGDEAARPGAARAGRQIVSPQERVGRAVSERRETIERSEVTIRDETGRARVRRPRRGGGGEARARIRLQRSGAT